VRGQDVVGAVLVQPRVDRRHLAQPRQGVALAAARYGIKAVVVMAENATPSKIQATRAYGAEVILHGTIWDEANEKAKQLVAERGYTYIHPFDDEQLIVGQGTVGLEIYEDWPEVERKRHLLRLWLSPPGARPLPPVFAECYGDLAIGDRGGIICKDTRLHAPLTPA